MGSDQGNFAPRETSPGRQTPHLCGSRVSTSVLSNSETASHTRHCESSESSREDRDPCPYYYDAKFDLEMYCGPGFEQFHPVLGSMVGHKEICDEWDARQLKQTNNSGQTRIADRTCNSTAYQTSNSAGSATGHADGVLFNVGQGPPRVERQQEQNCLEQVLVVFPQVQHDFVRKLFRQRHPGHVVSLAEVQSTDSHLAEAIVAEIAEMGSFPRQKELKRKHSPATQSGEDVTITWDEGTLKNSTYYKEALILLADEFTRVPTHFINKILREKGTMYDTFHFLAESENTFNNSPKKLYNRSKLGRVTLEKKYHRTAFEQRERNQYTSIVNEFQAGKQQRFRDENRQKRQKADEEAETSNFALHQLQGSLVDCQCCFNEAPINRVVNCESDETHFFCNKCIKTRAEEQIGAMKHEMICMDISGCAAQLSKEALARALTVKISDKLAELQQIAEIKAAGLDGLEQCPFCDFQAICASVDVDTTFECLNPDCERVSCRKCREMSHLPRSCQEARKDKGLDARHAIEEARSEAMMRSCPKCKIKIIKSAGCNKMTCSNCRAVMCYVCKEDITGRNYEHFGQTATACPLTDLSSDDRHQQEADKAENAAIAAAKARDIDVKEEDLRIGAQLNRRSGRGDDTAALGQPYGQRAEYAPPAVPQFQIMGDRQPGIFAGLERAEEPLGLPARINKFQHLLHDVHQHHNRVRTIVQDQQHQTVLLPPFLPAPHVPAVPHPARPLNDTASTTAVQARPFNRPIPPIYHVQQYLPLAHPGQVINGVPAQQHWDAFDGGRTEGLDAFMPNHHQGDALDMFHHDHRRDGNEFPAQEPAPFFNNDLHYSPHWPLMPTDRPIYHDNPFPQPQRQINQPQGKAKNIAMGQ